MLFLTATVVTRTSKTDMEIRELLKAATAAKATNPQAAIASLRTAYRKIALADTVYPIETFLRLPMYLQAAGRAGEALEELERLFLAGYPNQSTEDAFRLGDQAAVCDKKRLVLQREKRYTEALPIGVLSWALCIRSEMATPPPGTFRDLSEELTRRKDYADKLRDAEHWAPNLRKLMKPAKAQHAEDEVTSTVASWFNELPAADDNAYVERLTRALD